MRTLNNPLINIDPSGLECVWDDGSYDSGDDPDTGSYDKCTGQGGTWIDNAIFENSLYYSGDWSPYASSLTAGLVGDIQSCQAAVGGGGGANLLIADSLTQGLNTAQTAYVLASADWESGLGKQMTEPANSPFVPSYAGQLGNASLADAIAYRGRGYIQITGKNNYQNWSNLLGVNLVANPSLAATPEIASQIAVVGSQWGSFTGQGLAGTEASDFINDRGVINGDSDTSTTRWGARQ